MSKRYRDIKLTPQVLSQWAGIFKVHVVNLGNRVATKRDIDRVKKLVAGGLPFPPIVLSEYLVEGNSKYRVVYGAGLVSAILSYIDNASEKEKVTQAFKEFMRYEFTAFKGLNRKG